jgi:hypothetical protein
MAFPAQSRVIPVAHTENENVKSAYDNAYKSLHLWYASNLILYYHIIISQYTYLKLLAFLLSILAFSIS